MIIATELLTDATTGLIASGPLAVVLGFAVVTLWRTLQAERLQRAADADRAAAKLDAHQALYVSLLRELRDNLTDGGPKP